MKVSLLRKSTTILAALLFVPVFLYATHNRAGEITYKHISGNTYRITLTTYTYTPSAANETRDSLLINWGDDSQTYLPRKSIEYLPDDIQKNTYIGLHTFPGAGVYQIVMSDPNRNEGIKNIPESVTVIFSVKTILRIDPETGNNNTPVMLNPPIDKAAKGKLFIHNPNAYDPDGDSLSFKLATCLGFEGKPIGSYQYPEASTKLHVDSINGDFIWDTPINVGEYNVAIEVEEWRDGVKIGSIIRDMQIEVRESENKPPAIEDLRDFCITAGDTLEFSVKATDPEGDAITLSASGGPFQFPNSPAVFPKIQHKSPAIGTFKWITTCKHIRKQPYNILFRAEDNNSEVGLTDYENSMITVIAPAPQNLITSATDNSIKLQWDNYPCNNALGFKIYRRKKTYPFTPDSCETGIPADGNYTLVDSLPGSTNTSFTDDNKGVGLPQGYTYCYRIIAYFADHAESYTSNESCTELLRTSPIITKTSVSYTDTQKGAVHLEWMPPPTLNTTQYPPPYKYKIEKKNGLSWENFTETSETGNLTDTLYTDTLINTKDFPRAYRITLLFKKNGAWQPTGAPSSSASLFITGTPANRRITIDIQDNTPWTNEEYTLFRKPADELCTPNKTPYKKIQTSPQTLLNDTELENEKYYWYKIESKGSYDLDYIPKPLWNFSQEICISPQDTTPPCPVNLELNSNCDLFQNYLQWTIDTKCAPDIDNFIIFYSDTKNGELQPIDTITDNESMSYTHSPKQSLGACYVVTAQDSAGNYLPPSQLSKTCIDKCTYYELPNVFTPNKDGFNDVFKPLPFKFVEKIDMTIYNRWGNEVFKTEDPNINWDGKDQASGKPVSDGVYYYICDVYEKRLSGTEVRNISGFIRIFASKDSKD